MSENTETPQPKESEINQILNNLETIANSNLPDQKIIETLNSDE